MEQLTKKQIWSIYENHGREIIDLYTKQNKNCRQIGEIFSLKTPTVYNYLRTIGIKTRPRYNVNKYQIDETFFEKIDTSEKAYWLGWLMSDGNVHKNAVSINLQARDKEILEKFKLSIKSSAPIFIYKNKGFCSGSSCKFSFNNKKITSDLKYLGMVERKSLILKFPNILPEFVPAFMRGYIEGDGCVRYAIEKDNKMRFYVDFLATREFGEFILPFLKEKLGVVFGINRKPDWKERNINMYKMSISNKLDVIKILDYIYENCGHLFLSRKYNKYLEMKEYMKKYGVNPRHVTTFRTKTSFDLV